MQYRNIVKLVDNTLLRLLNKSHVNNLLGRYSCLLNINKNGCPDQKKVLVCYLTEPYYLDSVTLESHPKFYQMTQLVHFFCKQGYSIDICNYVNDSGINKINKYYDVIIGQGIAYKRAIEIIKHDIGILFLTENNPETVNVKYQERIDYFISRHASISPKISVKRIGIFDRSMIESSDAIIATTNRYNSQTLFNFCKNVFPINVNTLSNPNFVFSKKRIIKNRKSFLWFGSVGLIHKGLDILLDVFKKLPDYTLNVYGVPKSELSLFNKLKAPNTILHESVNVKSDRFLSEVVENNTFIISNSCSEGTQTGVATCMMCGMIPIISRETGYDEHDSIIMMEEYSVEYIINTIKKAVSLCDEQLIAMSKSTLEYSTNKFNNNSFKNDLFGALHSILNE